METHAQISAASNSSQTEQNAVLLDGLRGKLAAFELMLDEMKQLDFSGASSADKTIYGIGHRVGLLSTSARREAVIFLLRDQKKLAEAEVAESKRKADELEKTFHDTVQQTGGLSAVRGEVLEWWGGRRTLSDLKLPADVVARIENLKTERIRTVSRAREPSEKVETLGRQISEYRKEGTDVAFDPGWMPLITLSSCYFPSDLILALSVLLCGVVGAVAAGLRAKTVAPVGRAMALGAAAGFISYLALKGGKFLFLIQSGIEHQALINPYSAAFCGILAGLFTERAYSVLSNLINQLGERVIGEMQSAKDAKRSDEQAETKKTNRRKKKKVARNLQEASPGAPVVELATGNAVKAG